MLYHEIISLSWKPSWVESNLLALWIIKTNTEEKLVWILWIGNISDQMIPAWAAMILADGDVLVTVPSKYKENSFLNPLHELLSRERWIYTLNSEWERLTKSSLWIF